MPPNPFCGHLRQSQNREGPRQLLGVPGRRLDLEMGPNRRSESGSLGEPPTFLPSLWD